MRVWAWTVNVVQLEVEFVSWWCWLVDEDDKTSSQQEEAVMKPKRDPNKPGKRVGTARESIFHVHSSVWGCVLFQHQELGFILPEVV